MDLDDSVVGLTRDKVVKVSDFRTLINVSLMDRDADQSESMQLKDAVKYLRATKFDIEKAVELYQNYQNHREVYKLDTVSMNVINSEIRTRKLEVVPSGAKDPLILLYTASRHTPKSHDSHNTIQLFFHTLDQVSLDIENQTKGIVVLMDMRDCPASSFENAYATNLFLIFLNGYPIHINSVYIIEAPSWFNCRELPPYKELIKQGKLQQCSVSKLSMHISISSLPQTFGGSSIPTSPEAISQPISPTRKQLTPPVKAKPILQDNQGSVNKMKGRFANTPLKKPSTSPKPRIANGHTKAPKPNPNHHHPHFTQSVSVVEQTGKVKVPILPPTCIKSSEMSKNLITVSKDTRLKSPDNEERSLASVIQSSTKEGNSKQKSDDKKTSAKVKGSSDKGHDKHTTSHPPPSYNPPALPPDSSNNPQSQTKPSQTKTRYVNLNLFSNKNPELNIADSKHTPSPYAVANIVTHSEKTTPTTAATVKPSLDHASVTTPTQTGNTSLKLREPISVNPVTTKSEPETKKKKTINCYENIFFFKEVEDEGLCMSNETVDEAIYENFGPDEGNRWMTVDELDHYITKKGKDGLSAEYLKVKNEPLSGSANTFRMQCNTSKNRYKDVVCYDSTRVTLEKVNGLEGSDYIHANYVNGYERKQAFILTQGPLKRTVADYWRMLWEKEVFVVVMTTRCVEMAKLKCAQYWPDDGKPAAVFGNVGVSVLGHEQFSSFEFRKLLVQCEGQQRTLMHYQFTGWPDYGVPDTGKDIVELLYSAKQTQECFRKYVENPEKFPIHGPPLVIHCSAGIGRSGTFCALDYCIDELRMKGRVNIQHCVRQLRQQRAFAIQTEDQYRFCYETVLEYGKYLKEVLKI